MSTQWTSTETGQTNRHNDNDDAEKGLCDGLSLPTIPSLAYISSKRATTEQAKTIPNLDTKSIPIMRPVNRWILFHLWFNTYRKLFLLCTSLNLAAMISAGLGHFSYAVNNSGAMVLGNLLFAVLVRNELFMRMLYTVTIFSLRSVLGSFAEVWFAIFITILYESSLPPLSTSLTSASIALPWVTLRKVQVHVDFPSAKVAIIRFNRGMQQGLTGRISRTAVKEFHAFGIISEGVRSPCHYMVCGVQGDFTRKLLSDPPKTLWTRELKFAGIGHASAMYKRGIRVCTGTGIGAALSTCIQSPNWQGNDDMMQGCYMVTQNLKENNMASQYEEKFNNHVERHFEEEGRAAHQQYLAEKDHERAFGMFRRSSNNESRADFEPPIQQPVAGETDQF
ncbi:hypothetical protein FSARC_6925 [Fusarium sarcochroum]|uniref:Uncharacterized protein n=1 Tax=Fusarium sarcochroum TaxID=1208366 RepID=A0A8H4TW84_9HYPO|nr:hypothetical protein FSARC_6925 [Fusarium sarcochroum]